MNDQKTKSTERENRNRNSKNQKKDDIVDKLKLEFTREKPTNDTLKKYFNGII